MGNKFPLESVNIYENPGERHKKLFLSRNIKIFEFLTSIWDSSFGKISIIIAENLNTNILCAH